MSGDISAQGRGLQTPAAESSEMLNAPVLVLDRSFSTLFGKSILVAKPAELLDLAQAVTEPQLPTRAVLEAGSCPLSPQHHFLYFPPLLQQPPRQPARDRASSPKGTPNFR